MHKSDKGYLAGIAVLVIMLVTSCVINAYFFCQIQQKSNTEAKPETTNDAIDSSDIYDMPIADDENYENVENDNLTYTPLKWPAPGQPSDEHVYSHLHETVV